MRGSGGWTQSMKPCVQRLGRCAQGLGGLGLEVFGLRVSERSLVVALIGMEVNDQESPASQELPTFRRLKFHDRAGHPLTTQRKSGVRDN
jgi:hypothetical protein